jgi:hypothetical protein
VNVSWSAILAKALAVKVGPKVDPEPVDLAKVLRVPEASLALAEAALSHGKLGMEEGGVKAEALEKPRPPSLSPGTLTVAVTAAWVSEAVRERRRRRAGVNGLRVVRRNVVFIGPPESMRI